MNVHDIHIAIDSLGKGHVKLDGQDLKHCLGVKLHSRPGKVTVVRLLLRANVTGEIQTTTLESVSK